MIYSSLGTFSLAAQIDPFSCKVRGRRQVALDDVPDDVEADATSHVLADDWRSSVAKDLEHHYAGLVQTA